MLQMEVGILTVLELFLIDGGRLVSRDLPGLLLWARWSLLGCTIAFTAGNTWSSSFITTFCLHADLRLSNARLSAKGCLCVISTFQLLVGFTLK